MSNWDRLEALLKNEAVKNVAGADYDKFVSEVNDAITVAKSRENDNKRAATLIAVDAAKSFVQIAIALVVAILGFVQFSYRNVNGWLLLALAASAVLAFISTCAGFVVISKAYKQGDGRGTTKTDPWGTEPLRRAINTQALAGLGALFVFAVTLAVFNAGLVIPRRFSVTLPDGSTQFTSATQAVVLRGKWSELLVEQPGGVALQIPGSSTQQILKVERR